MLMARFRIVAFLALAVGWATPPAAAQPAPPLVLDASIPLDGVSGRIDHMTVDLRRNRLIVAELGNNTVDAVDLTAGQVVHRITGLSEPQGVGYVEKQDLLFVANAGDGSVRMFRGEDLTPIGSLSLGDDADNIRINSRDGTVVVGYGRGGLAVIDAERRAEVADIKLPVHPEGFQIDPVTDQAYVNLPDAQEIAVVDLDKRRVSGIRKQVDGANFPMALDRSSDLLAVVFRSPTQIALFDRQSGLRRDGIAACGDADDVFIDNKRGRIYVSCGSGEVSVFQHDDGSFRALHSVKTSSGARTSLFVPERDRLYVAQRAGIIGGRAAILVYRPVP
jgi:DNA-binding beta-propeller fold protein YncE